MPVQNAEVADRFERLAALLEIEGANPFRSRAYRNAAEIVRGWPRRVADMVAQGEDLSRRHGIGRDLAAKIREIVETGQLKALDRLERRMGPELADLLALPGLGPKRVKALHEELGVDSKAALARAARQGRVSALPGFGPKIEASILTALAQREVGQRRTLWSDAEPVARALVAHLKGLAGVKQVAVAGSYRRCRATLGDLDLLVTARRGAPVADHFLGFEDVERVLSRGSRRSSVILRSGLQVDLRVVPAVSYGAALHYFTGSKAHNIAMRRRGMRRGLKLNEYGVFRGERRVAGRTEEEIYRRLDLPWIEPELREDHGEIEAAVERRLPELIGREDLRGDLHSHTKATDGHASLGEMAAAARALGYQYLAISDHTHSLRVARGLDAQRLRLQLGEIDRLNEELAGSGPGAPVLLKSAEVEILEDGSLDLPDDLLEELDLTVCAVHSRFDLPTARQTERILRAMDHPRFHVLAHPTARLLGEREPIALDVERLIEGAAERGCFLEMNAQPRRMDLSDVHARMAKEAGVRIALSSDAHDADQLDWMRLGVAQARRAWLEKEDVLNTRSLAELRRLLRRR